MSLFHNLVSSDLLSNSGTASHFSLKHVGGQPNIAEQIQEATLPDKGTADNKNVPRNPSLTWDHMFIVCVRAESGFWELAQNLREGPEVN